MPNVIEKLSDAVQSLPPKLALAARYAIDHPDRIAFDSMRTVAATIGVASPTMLRLARSLGWDSYAAFKAEFQGALAAPSFSGRASALQVAGKQSRGALVSAMAKAAISNVDTAAGLVHEEALAAFAVDAKRAERIFLCGYGAMYWIAGLLESTGMMALSSLRADHSRSATSTEALAGIGPADIVLAFGARPYATATISAVDLAKRRGATVYALTDRPSSPLALRADVAFYAPTQSPHFYPSIVSFLFIAEALLAVAVAHADSLDQLKLVEDIRAETDAYTDS